MYEEEFKKIIESKTGCAVILAGSGSDEPHIEKIVKSLEEYSIPHHVRICSAHKQPDTLMAIINNYNSIEGSVAFIAVAGGTDALSGTLSYHAMGPVISCPPDGLNQTCLTNPPGSSNAYIQRPQNVGKFVAQMFAAYNPRLRELLEQKNTEKIQKLEEQDNEAEHKY